MSVFDWDDCVVNFVKDKEYLISPRRDIFISGHGWAPDVTLLENERYKAKFLRIDNSMSFTFVMLQPSDKEGDCQTFEFNEIQTYTLDGKLIEIDMDVINTFHRKLVEEKDKSAITFHEGEIVRLKQKHGW